MDMAKLGSADSNVCRMYVTTKFRSFEKMKVDKRKAKCRAYYLAVVAKPKNAEIVAEQYYSIFRVKLDTSIPRGNALEPHKEELEADLAQLKKWDEKQAWQGGEPFVEKLKKLMSAYDASACSDMMFKAEFGAEAKAAMTGDSVLTSTSAEATFDAILAMQQKASFEFECRTDNFGTLGGKIEESLKLGAWGNGKAAAAMSAAGFSAEAQFMFAAGMELNVEGNLKWAKGDVALNLGGAVNVFAGARAGAGFNLGLDAQRNLTASVQAGCFAGLDINCTGTCSFDYAGTKVLGAEATFGLKLGIGAEFSADFSNTIFGPMSLSLGLGAALGFGANVAGALQLDFAQMYTLGADAFRTAIYLPTLAQGWKMDLMTDDTRNRYYLKKSIAVVETDLAEITKLMASAGGGGGGYARLR